MLSAHLQGITIRFQREKIAGKRTCYPFIAVTQAGCDKRRPFMALAAGHLVVPSYGKIS
jgi:hypothetical protein